MSLAFIAREIRSSDFHWLVLRTECDHVFARVTFFHHFVFPVDILNSSVRLIKRDLHLQSSMYRANCPVMNHQLASSQISYPRTTHTKPRDKEFIMAFAFSWEKASAILWHREPVECPNKLSTSIVIHVPTNLIPVGIQYVVLDSANNNWAVLEWQFLHLESHVVFWIQERTRPCLLACFMCHSKTSKRFVPLAELVVNRHCTVVSSPQTEHLCSSEFHSRSIVHSDKK